MELGHHQIKGRISALYSRNCRPLGNPSCAPAGGESAALFQTFRCWRGDLLGYSPPPENSLA